MIKQNIGIVEYVVQLAYMHDELEYEVAAVYRIESDDTLVEADWIDNPNGHIVVSVISSVGMPYADELADTFTDGLGFEKVARAGYELIKKLAVGDVLKMKGRQFARVYVQYQVTVVVDDNKGDVDISLRFINCFDNNMNLVFAEKDDNDGQ